ncbi:MAG: type II 3-dehydroquinate dehydratase [Tenericutes bacterium]|nr:type II 3-dehydroquinate dehydratase [Mycoplasmatota bacterium]
MKKILVIHGPNLNLLGDRESKFYGTNTLEEINQQIKKLAKELDCKVEFLQSNHEGIIVDVIGASKGKVDVIIINPAAFTHTSVAIRDAVSGVKIPTIEVHLSNIYSREEFRAKSLIAPAVKGQISGFGVNSYLLALRVAVTLIKEK